MSYFVLFSIFTFILLILYLEGFPKLKQITKFKRLNQIFQCLPIILTVFIFVVGLVVRIHRFGVIPNGVNIDEASMGYDAFSLLHYGIDMNGYHNPVVLVGFGSGHQSLYAYFSMPFIALMGLTKTSIKMVNLVFGILSLLIFYLLVRRVDNQKVAIISLFIMAINPWHIMISRWGLDCNLFPAIFLIATFLFSVSEKHPTFFIISTAMYGVALYSYETSYFLIPIFIIFLIIHVFLQKKLGLKMIIFGLIVFILISLPIGKYLYINAFDLDPIMTEWLSIPKTLGPARYSTVSSLLSGGDLLQKATTGFMNLLRFMVFQEDSPLYIHNFVPGFGTTYLFSLPFQIIGLWLLILENKKIRNPQKTVVMVFWIISSLLLGLALKININRMNIIFIPLIYLIGKAVAYLHDQIKTPAILVLGVFLAGFILFTDSYFHQWPQQVSPAYNPSLDQAINFAAENTDGTIYLSDSIHKSYMYVLFYRQIDPNKFLDSVIYSNADTSQRDVASFGRYKFLGLQEMPSGGSAYIISNLEKEFFTYQDYRSMEFDKFSVYYP